VNLKKSLLIIGNFVSGNRLLLAPMAGITDHAFRRICREEGCGLVFSEMISAAGLLHFPRARLDSNASLLMADKPIAIQLFGRSPELLGRAAEMAEEVFHADIIDINMGCPAKKILKNREGGWLLRDPHGAARIMEAVVKKVSIPVTIKIRKGWDDDSCTAPEIARLARECGIKAVSIHGRTVVQGFGGQSDWDIIKEIKEKVDITVIGSGDIVSPEDIKKMLDHCRCDGVMIGRGALGNPWIFARALDFLCSGVVPPAPSLEARLAKALYHLELITGYKGEDRAAIEMRKHAHYYIKNVKNAVRFKNEINKAATRADYELIFKQLLGCQ
jgi:nifR3 family TIM-barrel protein